MISCHTPTTQFTFIAFFLRKNAATPFPPSLCPKLWAYFEGTAKNLGIVPVATGGTQNHAHLLLCLKPNMTIAEAVQKLKANSSRWIGEHGVAFEWQKGYAALSVSPSLVGRVREYVLNQEAHHRKRSFEQEFLALLKKAGIAHDEEGVFAA